jgi:hypothetical protein
MPSSQTRTPARFGRSRLGGGSAVLIAAAVIGGALLSSGLGALFASLGEPGDALLRFTVMAVVTLPVAAALVWAVLVDRTSLPEAVERPEDSIESAWYDAAARGAFLDTFVTVSLGAAVFSITGVQVDSGMLLLGLAVLIALDFAVRFVVVKRADA